KFCETVSSSPQILDLACGTGRHCFELERLGHRVEGSDASPEMIGLARAAAAARESAVAFHNFSFQDVCRMNRQFDVVISMFSAIDYLTTHQEIMTALRNIHGLLPPGGLFIFDYWNGNAVVRDYSPVKTLSRHDGTREITRTSTTSLDLFRQIATVNFDIQCRTAGQKQLEFKEQHRIRYFYFPEMEAFLENSGFDLRYRSRFMADSCNAEDWNITIVARKR
ncbi:MAG TPA: class I SAM-dependent methyltransferase, partial [Geobacteraceae bacterium]